MNFYELALLLADAQSRKSRYDWEGFIDNLSRICDEFTHSIHSKEKRRFASVHQPPARVKNPCNPIPKCLHPNLLE